METSSENFKKNISKQKIPLQKRKLKKKSKSFLIKEPPKLFNQNSKKNDPTPLKSRHSYNKENLATKDTFHLLHKNSLKIKKSCIPATKNLEKKVKSGKKLIKQGSRDNSLCETGKKISKCSKLNIQKSCNELKIQESANKLTPRSAYPSPQYSHRTPDNIKLTQRLQIPILTEKKSKIPEVGYYCKRFSMFDKSKYLYANQSYNSIEKESEKDDISNENFKKNEIIKFDTSEELSFHNADLSSITKTLKLDNLSDSPESGCQLENNSSPLKVRRNSSFISPERPSYSKILENIPFQIGNIQQDHVETVFSENSYASPTKTINLFNSPEVKKANTPNSLKKAKMNQNEPKAPKKGLAEVESPGSFVFSLSSNSSEDFFYQDVQRYTEFPSNPFIEKSNPFIEKSNSFANPDIIDKRDEEIQTDLLEMITDSKLLEGLKIIGKISECISLK